MIRMGSKGCNYATVLVAVMIAAAVFVPIVGSEDSDATTDYWTYTVTSAGGVTDSAGNTPTSAGPAGATGIYKSNDGTNVGSWGFDSDGYGPFGSFYAAFDACHGNRIISHLDPNDLTVSVDGSISLSSYSGHTINIMWILPTIYWSVNSSGDLILSNDPSKGEAYAHTIDGDVHRYLAIGVYEASIATVDGKTVLASTTGTKPLIENPRSVFREYANNNIVATVDGSTANGYAMLWNFYAWQLYRFSVLTVGGGWDTQGIFGNGDVFGSHTGSDVNPTGDLDKSGPYAGNVGNSGGSGDDGYHSDSVKAFIEDGWGSLYDLVDGVLIDYHDSNFHMYATQSSTPTDSASDYTTEIGVLPKSSGNYTLTSTNASTRPEFWGLPTGVGGSATSGLYDILWTSDTYSSFSPFGLYVGGCSAQGKTSAPKFGISYMYANGPVTDKGYHVGGRLAFVYDPISSAVTYDHIALTDALDDGGTAAAALTQRKDITAGGTYDRLPDTAGYRHKGWRVDGEVLEPEAGIVKMISHTIYSVWEPIVTLDHTMLIDIVGPDARGVSDLPSNITIGPRTAYPQLPDTAGYRHTGWLADGTTVGPSDPFVTDKPHIAESLWEIVPTVFFDHSYLTDIVGTDARGISDLKTDMLIEGNTNYPKLSFTAGYMHTGWEVDGQIVKPTAGFVKRTTHEAKSVWVKFIPIDPRDHDVPIEAVVEKEPESWLGKNGETILSVALIAVIIAELALLLISSRR